MTQRDAPNARIQIVFRKDWIVELDRQFLADYDTEAEAVACIAVQGGDPDDVYTVRPRSSAVRLSLTPAQAFDWDPPEPG